MISICTDGDKHLMYAGISSCEKAGLAKHKRMAIFMEAEKKDCTFIVDSIILLLQKAKCLQDSLLWINPRYTNKMK
jgi:hypothetical protein